MTVDVFQSFLEDNFYLKKKKEAKCFLRLETNWSWAGCIQSSMHPWTHQDCIKEGLQGGACPSRDDFTAPRGVTTTSTNGTGGGHACDSTTYHWNKVMTLGLWSRPPATTPHCYVCIQHTSSSHNNVHCISYFTSKTRQAVPALRNCSITITFVKKSGFPMNDQQQQMLHYSSIINGKPLTWTSLGWNRIWPVLVRNAAKSVYLVC